MSVIDAGQDERGDDGKEIAKPPIRQDEAHEQEQCVSGIDEPERAGAQERPRRLVPRGVEADEPRIALEVLESAVNAAGAAGAARLDEVKHGQHAQAEPIPAGVEREPDSGDVIG